MVKFILDLEYAAEYIRLHKVEIDPKTQWVSRCIDGRYTVTSQLPVLALPGADVGDLAILMATANVYGFELDATIAYEVLGEIVGGVRNMSSESVHSCMHLKHVFADPASYNLHTEDLEHLRKLLEKISPDAHSPAMGDGEHREGAVLQIKGRWGVQPNGSIETEQGTLGVSVYTFHQSLADARHRAIAESLISRSAVKLFEGLDAEYLSESMSSVTEDHLLETLKREAAGLPIFDITFNEDGMCAIKDLGTV